MVDEKKYLLDLRGEICPMPVLKTRKKIKQMQKAQILKVTVDSPVAKENILRTIKEMGEEVVEVKEEDHMFHITIKKTK